MQSGEEQTFMSLIHDWWSVLATTVGGFISLGLWMSRIHARTRENRKDIERLWKVREEDRENTGKTLDSIHKMQAEMRADIKSLLQRRD